MPFLTEELWHALYEGHPPAKSIALTRYPQPADFAADDTSVAAMATLQELITTIRAMRKELGVPEKEAAPIQLHAENRVLALADANRDMLAKMARDPAWLAGVDKLGGIAAVRSPVETDKFVRDQYQLYEKLAERLGLRQ